MVLYGITLSSLEEELRDTDTTILSPFYTNDAAFDGSARRIVTKLHLLMDLEPDGGYFPDMAKLIFIADNLEEKEAESQELEWAGLKITYVDGSQYMGSCLGPGRS